MEEPGQGKVKLLLENLYKVKKVPSSLLFYGVDATLRLRTAIEFSKGVLCSEQISWGCGKCNSCQLVEDFKKRLEEDIESLKVNEEIGGKKVLLYLRGLHPDLILIFPDGGQIRIDQIRALKSFMNVKPSLSRKKVAIIDSAHLMNLQASNSLLKVLEEPPEDSHIILTAVSKRALIPTVASRVFEVRFPPVSKEFIKENLSLSDDFLLALSKGSIDLAEELLKKRELVKGFSDLPSKPPGELLKLLGNFDRMDISDKFLILDVLEERVYKELKVNRINYDKAVQLLDRLGELRRGLPKGVKGSLALLSLTILWR